jgi:Flp pilus assembly protein TadG
MTRLPKHESETLAVLKTLFASFAIGKRGNVAIITAFLIIPIFALLGGAVDLIRWSTATAQLQAAVDAGALAASSITSSGDMEETAKDYVLANLPKGSPWDGFTKNNIKIFEKTDKDGIRKLHMGAAIAMPTYFLPIVTVNQLYVSAETEAEEERSLVEIALAVDISSSMSGHGKIKSLREAAGDFVNNMLAGAAKKTTSISLIPFGGHVNLGNFFDKFVVTDSSAEFDPDPANYSIGRKIPYSNFRFKNGGHCIELQTDDFSDDLIPEHKRPQVPFFWNWNTGIGWCPTDNSAVVLNSNDAVDLLERIEEMELSDGTGIDVGAAFALKALSPKWQGMLGGDFSDRPADFDSGDTMKFLILMTDGNVTEQFRPTDIEEADTTIGGNKQVVYSKDVAKERLFDICDFLKGKKVQIFTIGFDAGTAAEELMHTCATSDDYYFDVELGHLKEAFESIAGLIANLRVSR